MIERRYLRWICVYLVVILLLWLNAREKEVKLYSSLEDAIEEKEGLVVLVFFTTDCAVCWDELFEMRYFIDKNELPVHIVGISRDSKRELRRFLEKHVFYRPVVYDPKGELYRKFGVDLEPYMLILSGKKVVYRDDYYEDFFIRRERAKECLLKLARK
ncbi:MAG: peroxiredoxin family protein [Candidatus Aminicenantales bacterium]